MFRGLTEIFLARRRSRQAWQPRQAGLGKDRRVFYRVSVQGPCKMRHPSFGLEADGRTVDLSLEGAGLLAPVNWSEGSRVWIGLEAVGLETDGIVVFRREEPPVFRYGIKFQNLSFGQIVTLRRFLQKNHRGRLSE